MGDYLWYFGCGTSEHIDLIVGLFDRVPEHFRAKLKDFGLFLEDWGDIPEKARDILIKYWPKKNFRSWLILPLPGGEVWGTAWKITEEEMAIMGAWELRGLWFTEGDVVIENEQGVRFPAKTERTYYKIRPLKPVNSLKFQIFPNPKELMVRAARMVRLEFLSEKHDYNAFIAEKSTFNELLNQIEQAEADLWKIDEAIIKDNRSIAHLLKAPDVSTNTKVSLITDLINKLKKFCDESVKDLMRLKTKLVGLTVKVPGSEKKKLRKVISSLENIIPRLTSYTPDSLDKIKESITAHLTNQPADKKEQMARKVEFERLLDDVFKKTAEINELVSEERRDFSDISNIIKISREHAA